MKNPEGKSAPHVDGTLLEMGLRMTPEERLRWLEDAVEELLPWVGLATATSERRGADVEDEADP